MTSGFPPQPKTVTSGFVRLAAATIARSCLYHMHSPPSPLITSQAFRPSLCCACLLFLFNCVQCSTRNPTSCPAYYPDVGPWARIDRAFNLRVELLNSNAVAEYSPYLRRNRYASTFTCASLNPHMLTIALAQ